MPHRRRATLCAALLVLVAALLLLAAPAYALEPTDAFYVNDYAGILSSREADDLVQRGRNLYAQNGVQVVAVIVDNYIGESFEKYSFDVFNSFGIGSANNNNGLMLIVAVDDGDVRIEVGDGLASLIPDSKAGAILDRYFMPDAEDGDVAAAIYKTYRQLITEGARASTPGGNDNGDDTGSLVAGVIGLLILAGLLIGVISILRRAARRQPPSPPYSYPGGGYAPGGPTGGQGQSQAGGSGNPTTSSGPFYPYGGAPDYRLPRPVFFPIFGPVVRPHSNPWYGSPTGSGSGQSGQPNQPTQPAQRPSTGGGGSSSGGGARRTFPSPSASRTSSSRGRSVFPSSSGRSPFSGSGRSSGSFGGGSRSFGGGGRSFGGGASRGFKR